MARLRIRIEESAAGAIRALHPETKRKVRAALDMLRQQPATGKELRDEFAGLRSFRLGRMRIVYRTTRDALQVLDVGRRETIYEELARRLQRGETED